MSIWAIWMSWDEIIVPRRVASELRLLCDHALIEYRDLVVVAVGLVVEASAYGEAQAYALGILKAAFTAVGCAQPRQIDFAVSAVVDEPTPSNVISIYPSL